MRELDSVDGAGRTDNVGDVGDGGTRGSTEVESLGAGLDVDGLETTENASSQLGSERVPDTVFGLGGSAILSLAVLDGNTLLVVDALAGGQVGGGKQIFLAATDNEDTLVPVGFLEETRHVSLKILQQDLSHVLNGQNRDLEDDERRKTYHNHLLSTLGTTRATSTASSTTTAGTSTTTGRSTTSAAATVTKTSSA